MYCIVHYINECMFDLPASAPDRLSDKSTSAAPLRNLGGSSVASHKHTALRHEEANRHNNATTMGTMVKNENNNDKRLKPLYFKQR